MHKRREARHQVKQLVSPSSFNLISHPYILKKKLTEHFDEIIVINNMGLSNDF
jgi:hypothetical protein